jgi:hypothetical protein
VGKPEGKRPPVRPRHGWEDNIKMEWQGMDWIHLPQDRNKMQTFVNMASIKCRNFFIKSETINFARRTLHNGIS